MAKLILISSLRNTLNSAWNDEQSILQNGHSIINLEEMLNYPDNHEGNGFLTTKMPLYNQNHEIIGTYGVTRDITNIKQAEEQLQTAYDATLEGWAAALELREKETAKHSRNVVDMTLNLARNSVFLKRKWCMFEGAHYCTILVKWAFLINPVKTGKIDGRRMGHYEKAPGICLHPAFRNSIPATSAGYSIFTS